MAVGGKWKKKEAGEWIKVKNVKAETEGELQAGHSNSTLYLLEASEMLFWSLLEDTEQGGVSA